MDRAFASGASGTPPTAPASPSIGYPTKGNAGTGTPATKPGEYWYHMITEEMRAVIAAAGLTPSQSDLTQLLQALPGALASRPEMARSLAANGYQKLPSGLIIQWGRTPLSDGSIDVSGTWPIAFPNAYVGGSFLPDKTAGGAGVFATMGAVNKTNYGYAAWTATGARAAGVGASFLAVGF